MIKVLTGYSNVGGSTVAFTRLVNLFNENSLKACLYGPQKWEGITCPFETIDKLILVPEDILIYHFYPLKDRPGVRKVILSSHETEVFKLKNYPDLKYDTIHYVSEFQKEWQGLDGVVIPNPIRKFSKRTNDGSKKVAGIIGSIDRNKRVHLSITKALEDGFTDIRLYGGVTDIQYFITQIQPLLSDIVTYRGVAINMDYVYNQLTHVYHSPVLETFNLVKPECISAGVTYVGNEGNDTKAQYWSDEGIIQAWKTLLFT